MQRLLVLYVEKKWLKGKEPNSRVSTEHSQEVIVEKAEKLNQNDIMLRLIGPGHDMVAKHICYHKLCMASFKAKRFHSEKSSKTFCIPGLYSSYRTDRKTSL